MDWSLGDLAVQLAAGYGLTADPWQADPVRCIFARRPDGRWAAGRTKISVPRQNGKNGILEIVELFGMVVLGMKFLHTAHEVKTARKAFRRILSFFENERQFPELYRLAKEIRKTNGQEAIFLHAADCPEFGHGNGGCGCSGGGSIEFIARSSGSGRGFTVDVLVCDEDQDLTDEEQAALLPTISASPSGNPMVILTGTPPDLDRPDAAKGEVARRFRTNAQKGLDPRLCCFDWGAPDGPMPDVDDEALAYAYNPALGTRLGIEEVRGERASMSPKRFAQERYGWWGDPATARAGVIEMSTWVQMRGSAETPAAAVLVVDVEPDLSAASLGVAAVDGASGRTLVMVEHRATVAWAVTQVRALSQQRTLHAVCLTPTAAMLGPDLEAAGIAFEKLTNTHLGQACGAFQESVRKGALLHLGQPPLDAAVRTARTRYVGDLQHWDRKDRAVALSPLVAVSAAAHRMTLVDDYDPMDSIY